MEKDLVAKEYLKDAEHFCGFVNGVLFKGEERIQPRDVKEFPTELVYVTDGTTNPVARRGCDDFAGDSTSKPVSREDATIGSVEIGNIMDAAAPLMTNKRSAICTLNRFRDQAKEIVHPDGKVIIAIQNQGKTDFEMPLRVMTEDVMAYNEQRHLLYKKHYPKNGKLPLVITIVFCYENKWTGATDMDELVEVPKGLDDLKKYRPKYPMILVTPENVKTEHFPEEWRVIFEVLQRQNDGAELERYIHEHETTLGKLPADTKRFLNVMLDIQSLDTRDEQEAEEMCKAIEEIREFGREEGLIQGKAEGITEGQTTERILSIRNVMESLKTTVEQAMSILKIPEAEREKYASMVR